MKGSNAMVEAYNRISFSSGWKWIVDRLTGIYVAVGGKPRKVEIELPAAQRLTLVDQLAPLVQELEGKRREVVARVDERARRYALVPGLVVFILLVLVFRDLSGGIVFGFLVALVAWIVVQHKEAERYRLEVKERFGTALVQGLSDFTYAAKVEPDLEVIRAWKLFPELRKVEVEDRMTGERNGRNVALSRVAVTYHRTGGKNSRDIVLNVTCAEVEVGLGASGVTVVMPKNVEPRLRDGPGKRNGLSQEGTGDLGFDGKFMVFTSAPRSLAGVLDSGRRARILALEDVAQEGLPLLIFLPDRLVVLFPLSGRLPPFTPKPFYEPLDGEEMVAIFASDLALKYRQLAVTLKVGVG